MNKERIDALLDECGSYWLGGQKALLRKAMTRAVNEALEEAKLAAFLSFSSDHATVAIAKLHVED